jgi:hypothetical protein
MLLSVSIRDIKRQILEVLYLDVDMNVNPMVNVDLKNSAPTSNVFKLVLNVAKVLHVTVFKIIELFANVQLDI